ncbi:MAG: glutamine-hydrolyzing GMP synthase [Bacteriovoracales bacterium]|nr:glutamine-hydrolyzing GMP synthase [Bacteriovoracales bacterium]
MEAVTWIVDFGSQYTQLITRRSRELGYKALILTPEEVQKKMAGPKESRPRALILSGGPKSVPEDSTDFSFLFEDEGLPILGICYGMQVMGQFFGGEVERGRSGEYGKARLRFLSRPIEHIPQEFTAWMSHGDHLKEAPEGFETFLESENGLIAGIRSRHRPLLGLQFHPEVEHTEKGAEILSYFYREVAKAPSSEWAAEQMLEEARGHFSCVRETRAQVLCAFSGGVDSLAVASLAHETIGEKCHCFFVDHGLLRPQDHLHIQELQEKTPLNIHILRCRDIFLERLIGIHDPEEKRKIIGKTFIEVFERQVEEYRKREGVSFDYLLQGTLYPDVIESMSPHATGGKSSTIKSHHNVGGLPEKMGLKLLEPFRFFFKDEVRQMGLALGLEKKWVFRHPFPGPGIGIRIVGEVSPSRIEKVQASDQILFEELMKKNLYERCWQAFTVLLPLKTVGVKGDERAYEEVICLRLVNSVDGMTASWTDFAASFLARVSTRITNEVPGITRVVYDITSKPPGTIEWE